MVDFSNIDGMLDALSPTGGGAGMEAALTPWAKSVGLCLALCAGSYESWMMMLGRRGMDVMKLLRIVGVSLCISLSGLIASALSAPGKGLEDAAAGMARSMNAEVAAKEAEVAALQSAYLRRVEAVRDSLAKAKRYVAAGEDASWWEDVSASARYLLSSMQDFAKRAATYLESKLGEMLNKAVRLVGELAFQMCYYGILFGQRVFTAILAPFCPVMFALSLAPPFRSAWSQWTSKYLSLSLWGFAAYMVLFYADAIILYELGKDEAAYRALLGGAAGTWSEAGALGLQGIGSTCMYAAAMLIGAALTAFVPEAASWLVPGGASSGWGGKASGAVRNTASKTAGNMLSAFKMIVTRRP